MKDILPCRHFLYGGLRIPFIVEARVEVSRIILRTWQLSADAKLQNLASEKEIAEQLSRPITPFVIDNDPFGFHRSGRDVWVPLNLIGGKYACGSRHENLYLRPISQLCFVIDPLLLGKGAWSDYAVWSFNATDSGHLELPFNRYLETRDSKAHARMIIAGQASPLLLIYVPFAGDSFEHCSFVLQYNAALGCLHDFPDPRQMPTFGPEWQSLTPEQQFGVKGLLPALRLAGPDIIAAGASADFTVEMTDPELGLRIENHPTRLYLDSDAGYLPRRQVEIIDGLSEFSLYAQGLVPGITVRLKAGWRNYSGAAEKIITIV